MVPGGSIAHELQAYGIPWVFASQFPLTVLGSVAEAETLYQCLLEGSDPRTILYELRQRLHVRSGNDHDWAAVVAYASLPVDFDRQVGRFRYLQARRAVEVQLDRADMRAKREDHDHALEALDQARFRLDEWRKHLPTGEEDEDRDQQTECYGTYGAMEKRVAEVLHGKNPKGDKGENEWKVALEKSYKWYEKSMRAAFQGRLSNWATSQVLSLRAVLNRGPDPGTHDRIVRWADEELGRRDSSEIAWIHSSLAELEMLGLYHNKSKDKTKSKDDIEKEVRKHCQEIIDLEGRDSFHVLATKRQFNRYVNWWGETDLNKIATAALEVLEEKNSDRQS